MTKEEREAKKQAKLDAKEEKAIAKRAELAQQIEELKKQIATETNEKNKKKMRRQRDDLIAQREGIANSKDGMTIPMARKTKQAITAVISVVLVVALLCTYVATGAVRKGLLSYFGVPQSAFTAYTITDGDGNKHAVKVSTYNYYFAMKYNQIQSTKSQYEQYGIDLEAANLNVDFDKPFSKQTTTNDDGKTVTWSEYMQEEVAESIKNTYLYYYEAVAANDGKEPKMTDEQKDELKDTLKEYEDTAKGYGFTLSGYLTAAMGKGVTESVFRREYKIVCISENYQEELSDKLADQQYSNDKYEEYKKENYDDLKSVDIKLFECDSEDDAKAFKAALKADGSNFAALASKYSSTKWDKAQYKNDEETTYKDITIPTLKNMGVALATENDDKKTPNLDWLYSKDRKAGDIKQVSTTVVYVIKPVYMSNQKVVNVRHILIKPDVEDDQSATEATKKQWDAAEKKAKKILSEYKKGDKTAKAFGELAKENSADSNADQGGLYSSVTPHQMVNSFDAWCFDSDRKAGDTGIVKTEFGYHIMYFEGVGDLKVWEHAAQQSLAQDDSEKKIKELEDAYKIKTNWLGSRYFEKDTDIDS
ncbi:MAG: peptidylprolyl isomerase [Eubacterium sp.]